MLTFIHISLRFLIQVLQYKLVFIILAFKITYRCFVRATAIFTDVTNILVVYRL